MSLALESPAFKDGERIPKVHTCDGADLSPALRWSGAPAKTRSFALIMDDPDAPVGTWVHWVVYDLPASCAGLPEGVAKKDAGPDGARQGASWGVDEFSRAGYGGPCPPPGAPHRYSFRLYALDRALGLPARATKPELVAAMRGRVLAEAELTGLYGR